MSPRSKFCHQHLEIVINFNLSICCLLIYIFSVDDYPVYDPKFFKMIQEEAHRRHEAMKADKECDKNLYIRYVTQK